MALWLLWAARASHAAGVCPCNVSAAEDGAGNVLREPVCFDAHRVCFLTTPGATHVGRAASRRRRAPALPQGLIRPEHAAQEARVHQPRLERRQATEAVRRRAACTEAAPRGLHAHLPCVARSGRRRLSRALQSPIQAHAERRLVDQHRRRSPSGEAPRGHGARQTGCNQGQEPAE